MVQEKVENKRTKEEVYWVMKRKKDGKYFESVWEEWEEPINYSFTDDLSKAYSFYRFHLEGDYGVPKYLWDETKSKTIDKVTHLCEYFEGEMVQVKKEIAWEEI